MEVRGGGRVAGFQNPDPTRQWGHLHARATGRRVAGQEIAKWGVARGVRVGLDRESVGEGPQVATRVQPPAGLVGGDGAGPC